MDKPEILRRLQKAAKWSRMDFAVLIEECKQGICQFHEVEGGACFTTIEVGAGVKTCNVILGAGTLDAYVNWLNPLVEAFARANGCSAITFTGRPGFAKLNAKLDPSWKPVAVKFQKILN